jgi:hypothetical protein
MNFLPLGIGIDQTRENDVDGDAEEEDEAGDGLHPPAARPQHLVYDAWAGGQARRTTRVTAASSKQQAQAAAHLVAI